MSSEAEARRQVLAEMSRWLVDDIDTEALIGGVARATAVRDAYKEQIERRVLAQHFGSSGWPHEYVMRSGLHKENCRACKILNTARAAQTQETSG